MVAESSAVSASFSYASLNLQTSNPFRNNISGTTAVVDKVDIQGADQEPATYSAGVKDTVAASRPDAREVNLTRQEIRAQVQEQTVVLIRSYLAESPEVVESLKDFFEANPEAAEEISNGEIPEYFNVENTGRRILDIYFSRYDGEDRQEFAARARGIIEQAYSDVSSMMGGLPDIVQQTREYVLDVLDRFAAGEDVSDAISYDISAQESALTIDVEVEIDTEA